MYNPKPISVNKDFMTHAAKHLGFGKNDIHRPCELIDGEIDAGATDISMTHAVSDKYPGKRMIEIKGNGRGFPPHPKDSIIEELGQLGKKKDITNSDIQEMITGTFGIGTSEALKEYIRQGAIVDIHSESINGQWADVEGKLVDGVPCFGLKDENSYGISLQPESGTTIKVDKLSLNLIKSKMISHIQTSYFPMYQYYRDNSISFNISYNNENIQFHDPLFGHLKDEENLVKSWYAINNSGGDSYEIRVTLLYPKFPMRYASELIPVYENSDTLSRDNAGIYFQHGGKYVTLGNRYFGYTTDGEERAYGHNLQHIRVHVKNLDNTRTTGLRVCKSEWELNFDDKNQKDLAIKIANMVSIAESEYISYQASAPRFEIDKRTLRDKTNEQLNVIHEGNNPAGMTFQYLSELKVSNKKKTTSMNDRMFTYDYNGTKDGIGLKSIKLTLNTSHPRVQTKCKTNTNAVKFLVNQIMAIRTIDG